jgi:hypothetical protein
MVSLNIICLCTWRFGTKILRWYAGHFCLQVVLPGRKLFFPALCILYMLSAVVLVLSNIDFIYTSVEKSFCSVSIAVGVFDESNYSYSSNCPGCYFFNHISFDWQNLSGYLGKYCVRIVTRNYCRRNIYRQVRIKYFAKVVKCYAIYRSIISSYKGLKMEISSVNFIHWLDLTRSSCEKCNF